MKRGSAILWDQPCLFFVSPIEFFCFVTFYGLDALFPELQAEFKTLLGFF